MIRFITFCMLWIGSVAGLSAQMYFDDGQIVYGGESTIEGSYLALGINPAELGRTDRVRKGGTFLRVGGNFYSNGLKLGQVLGLSFTGKVLNDTLKQLLINQNSSDSDPFEYNGNLDLNWLSYSFAHPQIGGFAISAQDRIASTATLPNGFLGMALRGTESPAVQQADSLGALLNIADGTDVSYSHIRSVRLGYGRRIARVRRGSGKGDYRRDLFSLYAGVGVQLLWGIGYFDGRIEGDRFNSVASFSDLYRVNFGQFNLRDPNAQRQLLDASGRGVAFDVGIGVGIGEKLNLGASVVDLGSLTWDENVLNTEADFQVILDSIQDGLFDSYRLSQEVGNLYDWVEKAPGESFETVLNAQARLNAAYRLTERMRLGADLVLPLRSANPQALDYKAATLVGSFSWSIVPRRIYLSSGFIYNGRFTSRWPLALSLNFGGTTINVSTADLLTLVTRRDPLASLTLAFSGL